MSRYHNSKMAGELLAKKQQVESRETLRRVLQAGNLRWLGSWFTYQSSILDDFGFFPDVKERLDGAIYSVIEAGVIPEDIIIEKLPREGGRDYRSLFLNETTGTYVSVGYRREGRYEKYDEGDSYSAHWWAVSRVAVGKQYSSDKELQETEISCLPDTLTIEKADCQKQDFPVESNPSQRMLEMAFALGGHVVRENEDEAILIRFASGEYMIVREDENV